MLTVGLLSFLTKHRAIVVKDLEEESNGRKFAARSNYKTIIETITVLNHAPSGIQKACNALAKETGTQLREEKAAETTLFKSHLRRLRNVYTILMEICRTDEKLLGL
jgi:hypothetical protein